MSRGRKSLLYKESYNWEDIFWNNLPYYVGILNNYFLKNNIELIRVEDCLEKLSFTIPKGLNSKEIKSIGNYQVISQSKEFIIGYSDKEELLVREDLPLILFGDHSKTIKYVDKPFIIGADGVKLLKPKKIYTETFFYYFLHGVITNTKDYGRHFGLLKKGFLPKIENVEVQNLITHFLDDLRKNVVNTKLEYFNKDVEGFIFSLQTNQMYGSELNTELQNQLSYIKQLRQAYLTEAMQGKLVSNDLRPSEDTGQKLLEKIKAEKAQLIKDKKLKKEKPLAPIKPEDLPAGKAGIPFEIPENWVWCRLGDIAEIGTGATPLTSETEYYNNGNIPFVTSGATGSLFINSPELFITKKALDETNCKIYPKGTLIVAMYGQGKTRGQITELNIDAATNQACATITLILKQNELKNFVKFYFRKIYLEIRELAQGGAQPNLNMSKIINTVIPLPPLTIQNKIVEKLDELIQYCDDIEESIKASQIYNQQLLQQVLKEALEVKEEVS